MPVRATGFGTDAIFDALFNALPAESTPSKIAGAVVLGFRLGFASSDAVEPKIPPERTTGTGAENEFAECEEFDE